MGQSDGADAGPSPPRPPPPDATRLAPPPSRRRVKSPVAGLALGAGAIGLMFSYAGFLVAFSCPGDCEEDSANIIVLSAIAVVLGAFGLAIGLREARAGAKGVLLAFAMGVSALALLMPGLLLLAALGPGDGDQALRMTLAGSIAIAAITGTLIGVSWPGGLGRGWPRRGEPFTAGDEGKGLKTKLTIDTVHVYDEHELAELVEQAIDDGFDLVERDDELAIVERAETVGDRRHVVVRRIEIDNGGEKPE